MLDFNLISSALAMVRDNHFFEALILIVLVYFIPKIRLIWKRAQSDLATKEDTIAKFLEDTKNDLCINQALEQLVFDFHASSAFVLQFHNGGANFQARPFRYVTCTHEILSPYGRRKLYQFQRVPTSFLAYWMEQLMQDGFIFCECIKSCFSPHDKSSYQIFLDHGVDSLYVIGIFDSNRVPIACVGIDYRDKTLLSEEEFEKLKCWCLKIGGRLLRIDPATIDCDPKTKTGRICKIDFKKE